MERSWGKTTAPNVMKVMRLVDDLMVSDPQQSEPFLRPTHLNARIHRTPRNHVPGGTRDAAARTESSTCVDHTRPRADEATDLRGRPHSRDAFALGVRCRRQHRAAARQAERARDAQHGPR